MLGKSLEGVAILKMIFEKISDNCMMLLGIHSDGSTVYLYTPGGSIVILTLQC